MNLLTLRHFRKLNECWDAQQTAIAFIRIYNLLVALLRLLKENFSKVQYFKCGVDKFDPKNGQGRSFAAGYLHTLQQTALFPKDNVFICCSVTNVTFSALVVLLDPKDPGVFINYEVTDNGNNATVKN